MADTPTEAIKTDAPAEAAPVAEAPPSLLAGADPAKREGAPEAAEAKPDSSSPAESGKEAPPPKPEGEATPEAKPDAQAKPEGEAKPEAEAAAQETKAEETPPAPPVYGELKLPDGFKLEDAKLKEFDSVLGKFESEAKADHAQVEGLRQSLVDFYQSEVQRIGEQVAKHQVDVWNRLNETRINELKSDPQLGGNRIETTLGNAKYALETMTGLSKQEASELLPILDAGGVSNHRLFIKMLHGLYERYREPEPVPPALPTLPTKSKEAGQRGWYNDVDGVKV